MLTKAGLRATSREPRRGPATGAAPRCGCRCRRADRRLVFLVLPLAGLLFRAPWCDLLGARLAAAGQIRCGRRSGCRWSVRHARPRRCAWSSACPLAWVLARADFPGRGLVRALVTVPLVLPPVVGGVALLLALGRNGLVGQLAGRRGSASRCRSPRRASCVAEAFVAMPFLVISVEGALRAADPRYEEAAATLGASRWTIFRRVTLPLIAPGVVAGRGAVLGAGAGRVRRHDHVRRATSPAVPRRCRSRSTSRWRATRQAAIVAQPGPARRLGRRAGRPARTAGCAVEHVAMEPAGASTPRRRPRGPRSRLDVELHVAERRRGRRAARAQRRRQDHRPARPRRARTARRDGHICGSTARRWHAHARSSAGPVGVVFQDYLLFPHLSALDNVAFGPRCHGVRQGRGTRGRAAEWLDRVGLADHAGRRPRAAVRRAGPARRPRPRAGRTGRGCCCSTSRSPRSTPAPGSRSAPELRRHLAEFDGVGRPGHARPARRDGARRPARRHRGRPGRPGGHPGARRAPSAHGLRRAPRRPQPLPRARPTGHEVDRRRADAQR